MRVLKSNEHLNTAEIQQGIEEIHQMIETIKRLRQEVIDKAHALGLWHLELVAYEPIDEYTDVRAAHAKWLASNHNC